jgi:Arc/MetJ-type ribon-helix-helix transcriptional regulator
MPARKVAITVDERLLGEVDEWVARGEYPSRSGAFQAAVARLREERHRRGRLIHELARLRPDEERALADEALTADEPWPEY